MSSKERQRESEVVVEAGGMISLGESQAVESWQSAKLYRGLPGLN